MSNILVSIIIPVYNATEIVTTLQSCLVQTYSNIEILVVDDCSTVNIASLVCELKDDRIRFVQNDKHTNANVCRNIGLNMSSGEYIIFLDSDDILMRNHIQSCIDRIESIETDGIYSSLIIHNGTSPRECIAGLPSAESWVNYMLRRGFSAQTSTLFLSRCSAIKTRWDETLLRHQDYDFVARYTKTHRLDVKTEATVIYNADPRRTRTVRFDDSVFKSCIHFSTANKQDISSNVYRSYISGMLKLAKSCRASAEIISYYENELK